MLYQKLKPSLPRSATEEELALCHTPDYINLVKKEVAEGRLQLSTGDVIISLKSFEVALMATGAVLTAVDAVIEGKAKNPFCLVRPPGHHATTKLGMGFCIFNNVAIGARYAQSKGHKKILIIDWDVHHGNGTQEIFYNDPSVTYFSTHQWPLYPGTGTVNEVGAGNIINCPIAPGPQSREAILDAFHTKLPKGPFDFVFISAGFDAITSDPLGNCNLTNDDISTLTHLACSRSPNLVSVLEGGYNLSGIASAASKHVESLSSNQK